MVLFSDNFSSKAFLFVSKTFRLFPGCTKEGALGNTARAAISPQLNLSGPLPKYLHDAASNPTTLLPKGALDAYNAIIFFLEYRHSNLTDCTLSIIFCQRFLFCLCLLRRITCIVIVLPPCTMPLFFT